MKTTFLPGIDILCRNHADWFRGRRIGLVAHPASVGTDGTPSAELLRASGASLMALFGPEHGFSGAADAGEEIPHREHPEWRIPIHSLYGKTRRPTAEMLHNVDTIVFDLQDLGARPYTYVSTLRYVLESADEHERSVIVADRPCPMAQCVDGPMLDPAFESFVGCVSTPVVYGMTPGETALWLKNDLNLDVDVRVAAMRGYSRDTAPGVDWPAWIRPSPAIRSWECAVCFAITVYFEALPGVDHGRGTETPFRVIGAPWLDPEVLLGVLAKHATPGIRFSVDTYQAMSGNYRGQPVRGLRLEIEDPAALRPVETGVTLIAALQEVHGGAWLWSHPGTRPEFFDQLMGTDRVRKALHDGLSAAEVAEAWRAGCEEFASDRSACLLYPGRAQDGGGGGI
jgi:uncharacterized protein YbbC (DUF1343 family)